MKRFLLILSLSLGSGAAMLTTSCSSSSDPTPAKATLSGQITPAGAVSEVTATNAAGQTATATPTSTGTYSFPNLAVGAYTLSFTPAPGYATPAPQQVTLAASGTTASPTTATLAPASVSYTVDGTVVNPTYIFSQSPFNDDRMLTFALSPGGAPGPTLTLFLEGVIPTVGTRSLIDDHNSGRYTGPDYILYDSSFNTGTVTLSGSVTITSVNTAARRFSGTFSFLGIGVNTTATSPETRTIANGVFTNVTY
jgi:hypothetical protein